MGIAPRTIIVSIVQVIAEVGEPTLDEVYITGSQNHNIYVSNPFDLFIVYEGTTEIAKQRTVLDSHPVSVYYYR